MSQSEKKHFTNLKSLVEILKWKINICQEIFREQWEIWEEEEEEEWGQHHKTLEEAGLEDQGDLEDQVDLEDMEDKADHKVMEGKEDHKVLEDKVDQVDREDILEEISLAEEDQDRVVPNITNLVSKIMDLHMQVQQVEEIEDNLEVTCHLREIHMVEAICINLRKMA